MTDLTIKTCPTCGSRRMRKVHRDIESRKGGESFIAKGIEIEECPNCGERLFSPEALEAIAAQRPRRHKPARRRKSA